MEKTKTEVIMDYAAVNPGKTSAEIAKSTGISQSVVATILWQKVKAKHPLVRREVKHTGPTGKPIYKYFRVLEAGTPVDSHETAPTPAPKPKEPRIKPAAPVTNIDDIINSLAGALVAQVVSRVKEQLGNGLAELVPPAPVGRIHHPALEAPKACKKPKVAVVGLLPQQAGLIAQEYRDCFDLSFPNKDDSKELKSAATHCDKVYEMTKFIGHSTENTLLGAGAALVRVAGGMTELRDALTEHFVKHC